MLLDDLNVRPVRVSLLVWLPDLECVDYSPDLVNLCLDVSHDVLLREDKLLLLKLSVITLLHC